MVCAPVRSIIPSLKLGDYLSAQAHKPCSISRISIMILYFDLLVTLALLQNTICQMFKLKENQAKSKIQDAY